MPVINGVYLKDFTALPGAVIDADIIPIAITGNQIAYRTTVAGIVTDARITAKLLTGLSVTGGAVVAADTILQAFGKVQNQINGKQGTITLTTTGTSGAATFVSDTLNIPQYADAYVGTVTSVGLSSATSGVTIGSTPVTTSGTITIAIATATSLLNGLLSSTDWTTFNNKQGTITLTTTGTSGAATFSANTLNIPNYADSFVGTVTSVAALTLGTTGSDLSSTVANGTTTPVITLQVPTASASNRGALSSADWTTFNNKAAALSGTINTIAYWDSSTTIASLALATYPSLTELSYVKGVTSAIQTQLNAKQATITLTTTGTSGAATFSANTLNIPQYQAAGTYVTSVTGTSPIVSSGGTTPAISIPVATTLVNGYLSSTDWTTFNGKQATITLTTTGTSGAATFSSNTLNIPNYADSFVGTVTSVAAITLGTTGSDLSSTVANGTTTPVITLQVPTASASNRGALSSADWSTFNGKQGTITLTTTGTSGAATFSANTLNIPNYADGGVLSLSAIGATANANAATITGTVLNLQPADASFGGVVTTGTQTFAGAKTLTGALSGTSATFSTTINAGGAIKTSGQNLINEASVLKFSQESSTISQIASYGATTGTAGILNIKLKSSDASVDINALSFASTGAATFSSTATATAFIPSGATVPTNGMYLSAANTLNFATNTTNRLSIASTGAATFSGNLSCSGASIQLNQTELISSTGASNRAYAFGLANVAAGDFSISQGSTATGGTYTTRLTINPTGYVGIGTTSPSEKLEVNGAIKTAAPSGGTAKPFKVGAVSETGPAIVNKVMVEIDSVVYYIPLSAAVV